MQVVIVMLIAKVIIIVMLLAKLITVMLLAKVKGSEAESQGLALLRTNPR